MGLKFSKIKAELSDSNFSEKIRFYDNFPNRKIIGLKKIEELGKFYDSAFLYVGCIDGSINFDEYQNLSLLVYGDDVNISSKKFTNYNMIVAENETVCKGVAEKIAFYIECSACIEDISAHLFDILKGGGGIQEILDYGYEKLGNPLLLVDSSFNFLGTSGTKELNDEPVWEYTIKNGFMPNYYLNDMASEEYADGASAIFDTGSLLNHRQLAVKIIQNRDLAGYIKILEYGRAIDDLDKAVLKKFADFLAIAMSKRMSKEKFKFSVIENFLTSILLNKITNPEEIESRMELFGIKLQDKLYVITIEVTDYRMSDDKKYDILIKIKKYFNRNNVVLLNNYIVVLYDIESEQKPFSGDSADEFIHLLEENNCQANISFDFDNLKDFYKYYIQTVYCMQMRDILGISNTILKYRDIIQYHMILNFAETIDLDIMVEPAVRKLISIDSENDSNYVKTLFTYVNCQQNLSKAAEKMFVHYNTLKYRINRIIEMTNVNLADERVVFEIMITEKILKIKELMSSKLVTFNEAALTEDIK